MRVKYFGYIIVWSKLQEPVLQVIHNAKREFFKFLALFYACIQRQIKLTVLNNFPLHI